MDTDTPRLAARETPLLLKPRVRYRPRNRWMHACTHANMCIHAHTRCQNPKGQLCTTVVTSILAASPSFLAPPGEDCGLRPWDHPAVLAVWALVLEEEE